MQDLERKLLANPARSDSLPIADSGGHGMSSAADEMISPEGGESSARFWNSELLQQLSEHGRMRKTKCPVGFKKQQTDIEQRDQLGRKIIRVLRHVPDEVYLRMDVDGWVHVEQLGEVINHICNWDTRWSCEKMQALIREIGIADRIQFDRHRCRASYGHSTNCYRPTTYTEPSEPLFHGTCANNWQLIECFGLVPMRRRFVQWTTDFDYAMQIASHGETPIVLQVLRAQAIAEGIRFISTGCHVWLTESIPVHLLQVWLPDQS